jgi:hypothetical protein
MKITKRQLRKIIRSHIILENKKKIKGKVWFAYRNITGTENIVGDIFPDLKAGHAWIMVQDPETGEVTSYSGKSGIVFTASDMIKRIGLGRDDNADVYFTKLEKAYNDKKITEKELKHAIENTDWKNLKKMKDWSSDKFGMHDAIIEVMPRYSLGDTQQSVNNAIKKIQRAFDVYEENVPYDPLPGSQGAGSASRNSNSFAYTLLRNVFSDQVTRNRVGNLTMALPGWGMIVKGMKGLDQS